jgi:hypothetical protein
MKFDLKSFVTICMTISLIAFTYMKIVEPSVYVSVATAVFTYYFAHKKEETNDVPEEFTDNEGDD